MTYSRGSCIDMTCDTIFESMLVWHRYEFVLTAAGPTTLPCTATNARFVMALMRAHSAGPACASTVYLLMCVANSTSGQAIPPSALLLTPKAVPPNGSQVWMFVLVAGVGVLMCLACAGYGCGVCVVAIVRWPPCNARWFRDDARLTASTLARHPFSMWPRSPGYCQRAIRIRLRKLPLRSLLLTNPVYHVDSSAQRARPPERARCTPGAAASVHPYTGTRPAARAAGSVVYVCMHARDPAATSIETFAPPRYGAARAGRQHARG